MSIIKRAGHFVFVLTLLGVVIPGYAQNLVQNPSFESVTAWDEFWFLSTTAPSTATAVATENITDAHEGSKSVELSNSAGLEWTYFYTNTARAPIVFSANQSYEVKGWIKILEQGKRAELSIFWNNSLDEASLYKGNPDPVSDPDWFMVEATITPTADYSDGYLSLGFRADKDGTLGVGRILFDDFSVTRLPSTETDIIDFSIPEQTGPAIVDALLHMVTVEVPYGTDVTALVPTMEVSPWAIINPASGAAVDFTSPFVYTVTAEDGITMQDWMVTVTFAPPSTETEIVSFTLAEQAGPATIDNIVHTVVVKVPFGTDVTALAPTISLSAGATLNPGSGVARNFSAPVVYTVTAEDGTTTQDWAATVVILPNTETEIIAFTVPEQTGPANINNALHNVIMEVKYGTDVSALAPSIALSPGATINPASGVAVDFSVPVVYRVTAEDGITKQNYIVAIMVSTISNETDIIGFTLPEQDGPATIDNLLHTVTIEVPFATDATSLVPSIGMSAGATIDPAGGVAADFSTPVIYTVTAEDGVTVQEWTATVIALPNTETDIVSFSLAEQSGMATIDNLLHTVEVEVPHATDVSSLVPTIGLSAGAASDPAGGASVDFSVPVVYTVTADDGVSMQDWTVTVVIQPNTETEIVDFYVTGQIAPASIDSILHIITAEVPDGTDVTALIPTIGLSAGATIAPSSGVSGDFSTPVVYTVIAEDGVTEQDWTVAVLFTLNTEADIVSFSLAEQSGPATIDSLLNAVTIEVPSGTDVAALVPTIGLSSGATVDPASGLSVDLSAPVVFTVTAEDGVTTQDWTVTVVKLPNTETEIVDFLLTEQTGPATIDNLLYTVTVEVGKETDVTTLVPTIGLSTGATIDPASGVSVDLSAPVIYTVTAEDGITSQEWTVSVTVDPAVSVQPANASNSFNVYPNPARDLVHVELSRDGNIYLRDITGRVVTSINNASSRTTIPVTDFERGIYFIQLIRHDYSQVVKIILE